jgi:predicted permease
MFRNYLKTAFRNLKRNKSYAVINLSGLAVGIAASMLIFLVIQFETSFDNFHKKKDSIYRVNTRFYTQDGYTYSASVSFPVGPALRLDFPQIKEVASTYRSGGQITIEDGGNQKKLNEPDFYFAEPEFFTMFDFDWLVGNASTCLKNPNTVALTQSTAEKFFGDWKTAIGKNIKFENKTLYKVAGILKNPPPNTDFPFSIVAGYTALQNIPAKNNLTDWVSTFGGAYTFVVLPTSLPAAKFNTELVTFSKKHKPAEYLKDAFITQPLSEIHYDDRFGNYTRHTFSHSLITALALIGLFLILIACVNFINLATAQAVNRSREVGIRKVLGSNRLQLAFQFLGETALITTVAMVLAIFATKFTLPFLNSLLQTKMTMNLLFNPWLVSFILATTILVTLLSGLYPSLILSGFNPITALKSKITSRMVGGISLRRALVVLQFAIAQILIIGVLIVVSQMNFFRNASLGFDKDFVINVPVPHDSVSRSKMVYLRNQLLANNDIQNVSFSFAPPSSNTSDWETDFKFDHSTKSTNFSANLKWADADYFKTYNLQFLAGRSYYPSDTIREFVVNETLLHKLGVQRPEDAIGKEISLWDGGTVANIVGVIKDFNVYSLKEPVAPVILSTWKDVYGAINIKLKAGAEKSALPFIEKLWNQSFPDYVYQYQFLDNTIANFYKQETELSTLYEIFAAIAIFISCLGLYGLVSFMAVQRTKEVGIRKVLGASASHIVYLMSKEFTLLIIIAFIISAPIAYYIMHKWLQNYSYRTPLSVSIFLLAIFSSIIIAWITVGQRAVRAAMANPVKSLRTE